MNMEPIVKCPHKLPNVLSVPTFLYVNWILLLIITYNDGFHIAKLEY